MHQNTPPSSLNGDDVDMNDVDMDEEDVVYLEEIEPLESDFDDFLEEVVYEEDENALTEPREDHAVVVFDKHDGSVFCCDFHPNGKLATTGGEDDTAFVWNVETGKEVMKCAGHKDSVIFVGFSFDGTYLATADMSGVIKVWKCSSEENTPWPLVFEYDADELSFGLWHFGARVLICGSITGLIYIFKIPSGETKIITGHSSKVECGKLFHDGVRLATGYEDGVVKIWDLKTSTILHQVPAGVHEIRVTALDIHPDDSLVASISSDGKVVVITASNGKVVAQLQSDNNLEAIAFQQDPQTGYIGLGSLTGAVSIWDVGRQMVRHQCVKSDVKVGGVTKMIWVKNHLITACLDGSVRAYESLSGERSLVLTGHNSEVLDLCYNAKENFILTASDDGTARIFKYELS